jgi:hypothetical protein
MITPSHTIIDPLTVVIKLVHTFVADVAMSRIAPENCFTCWTKTLWVGFINKLAKFQAFDSFDNTWVKK